MCGYKVFYMVIVIVNEKYDEVMEIKEIILNFFIFFIVFKNLSVFIRYEIEVLVFIVKGDGVWSDVIRVGMVVWIFLRNVCNV